MQLCVPVSCGFTCTLGNGYTNETLVPVLYRLVISNFVGAVGGVHRSPGLAVVQLFCSV